MLDFTTNYRLQKSSNQWMRLFKSRASLRHEQRPDKKRMLGVLNDADLTLSI
jgi:hypothetical protein